GAGREQAVERRQAKPLLAARERREGDQQSLPAIVMPIPSCPSHRAITQRADRIAISVEFERCGGRVGRMQEVAVLGREQKDQSIDKAEKLAEELRQRQRAASQTLA